MTIKSTTGKLASGMSLSHFCNDPSCSLPHCTPPVGNSKAVGGPSAEDGQGVCIPRYVIHYLTFGGVSRVSEPLHFAGARDLVSGLILFRGQVCRIETVLS